MMIPKCQSDGCKKRGVNTEAWISLELRVIVRLCHEHHIQSIAEIEKQLRNRR